MGNLIIKKLLDERVVRTRKLCEWNVQWHQSLLVCAAFQQREILMLNPHINLTWCPNLEDAWMSRAVSSSFVFLFEYINKFKKFKVKACRTRNLKVSLRRQCKSLL